MAKHLSKMTTEEVRSEMSIAGNPDQCIEIMNNILKECGKADTREGAVLINLEFALERVLAEIRLWKKMFEKRTGQELS